MNLDRALADEMFAHAKAELPNEACGILAGSAGKAVHFFPAENAEHSPTRYVVEPKDQLRILNELHQNNWDLLGIFHSHTHTQAYPSSTDVSLAANWPDAYYLIASLQEEPPHLRAYRILDGQVTEEEISYS
ncbi:MAG TPA: M67 family metallopeptidase [Chloroflexota bacterium]|nr:M67 family metallopeptidase [Chloroflexota bacterium]